MYAFLIGTFDTVIGYTPNSRQQLSNGFFSRLLGIVSIDFDVHLVADLFIYFIIIFMTFFSKSDSKASNEMLRSE
jgi:hypothetical protein